jgi:hypothetical protein
MLIAHRGNIRGPNPDRENAPDYIDAAIAAGFDVEIDVWSLGENLWLGHDGPQYEIEPTFLYERAHVLWCHAKNLEALVFLIKNGFNAFSHDKDDYVLTSKGFIWALVGSPITPDTICVMPERASYSDDDLRKCKGICTDKVLDYISNNDF